MGAVSVVTEGVDTGEAEAGEAEVKGLVADEPEPVEAGAGAAGRVGAAVTDAAEAEAAAGGADAGGGEAGGTEDGEDGSDKLDINGDGVGRLEVVKLRLGVFGIDGAEPCGLDVGGAEAEVFSTVGLPV